MSAKWIFIFSHSLFIYITSIISIQNVTKIHKDTNYAVSLYDFRRK
jgi:hypothetical protein